MDARDLRRGAFLLIVVVTTGALGAPSRAEAPGPRPPARTFDPAVAAVDVSSSLGLARAALERGDFAGARSAAESALAAAVEPDASRLRWIAGTAAMRAGAPDAARAHLEPVLQAGGPLAPWAGVRLAATLEEAAPAEALAVARRVTVPFPGAGDARTIEARARVAVGEGEPAIEALRAIVREAPPDASAASSGLPLARALLTKRDVAATEEAIAILRRIATRAPLARAGIEAETMITEALTTLPRERRIALAEPSVDELRAKADALFAGMRHADAAQLYGTLASRLAAAPDARCEVELRRGRALERNRARTEAAGLFDALAASCPTDDQRAWARYHAGRVHSMLGDDAKAIAAYDALLAESPAHRLADDALLQSARASASLGDDARAEASLRRIVDTIRDGDMYGDALFLLAWRAFRRQELAPALELFERAERESVGDDVADVPGRASYWRARVLATLGRRDEALAAHDALVSRAPLSYYAQQATLRVRELDAARADALRARTQCTAPPAASLRFAWRPELDTPAFARALELLRVGEVDLARRELATLGAFGEGADPDFVWLVAATLDRAGAYPEASRLARRRLVALRRTAPAGDGTALWRIAYPRAFAPLVENAATESAVPASFLRAVAREESAFDPDALSSANAIGLVQLLVSTATPYGRTIGVRVSSSTLRDPAINLRLGARHMAFLWQRYGGADLVPAAYNAGHGALDRWLREQPGRPFDVFVEEIPYDETRRYIRRVLQSYFVYATLDGDAAAAR